MSRLRGPNRKGGEVQVAGAPRRNQHLSELRRVGAVTALVEVDAMLLDASSPVHLSTDRARLVLPFQPPD